MGPFSPEEIGRLWKLAIIGVFGMLAWLSNYLFHGRKLPIGRFIGGMTGAMIASMSVVGVLHSIIPHPSVELTFGIAGIVGWVGGNSLARIFDMLEKRLYQVLQGGENNGRPER